MEPTHARPRPASAEETIWDLADRSAREGRSLIPLVEGDVIPQYVYTAATRDVAEPRERESVSE